MTPEDRAGAARTKGEEIAASTCDCVAKVNEELRKKGLELDLAFSPAGAFPHLAVVQVNKARPYRPPLVLPSFCPFCGRKL